MDIRKFEKELILFDNLVNSADESVEIMESCVDDAILEPITKMIAMYKQWMRKHVIYLTCENLKLKSTDKIHI